MPADLPKHIAEVSHKQNAHISSYTVSIVSKATCMVDVLSVRDLSSNVIAPACMKVEAFACMIIPSSSDGTAAGSRATVLQLNVCMKPRAPKLQRLSMQKHHLKGLGYQLWKLLLFWRWVGAQGTTTQRGAGTTTLGWDRATPVRTAQLWGHTATLGGHHNSWGHRSSGWSPQLVRPSKVTPKCTNPPRGGQGPIGPLWGSFGADLFPQGSTWAVWAPFVAELSPTGSTWAPWQNCHPEGSTCTLPEVGIAS